MPLRISRFLMLALLLLNAAGCGQSGLKPEAAAHQFLQLWKAEDYEAMYEMLDPASRERYSLEQFCERYRNISRGIGLLSLNYQVHDVLERTAKQAGVSFRVNLETSTVGPVPVDNVIRLTRNSRFSPWSVAWGPQLIFPELSDDRRVELIRQVPPRGNLLDHHGQPLATSRIYKEIGVEAGRHPDQDGLLQSLAALLDVPVAVLRAKMEQPWVDEGLYVPLVILAAEQEHLLPQLLNLPGVAVREVERRFYPAGKSLGHLTGYLDEITAEELEARKGLGYSAGDLVGKAGVEAALEQVLAGSIGFLLRVVETDGTPVALMAKREALPGSDVTLTIDLQLQQAAVEALGEKTGAVVALDPRSGDVLALASNPGYDPNWFVTGQITSRWQDLAADPRSPLLNRALEGLYPPGSIFKAYTAAVALQENILDPERIETIKGYSWQPSPSWGGYRVERINAISRLNLYEAMKYSDNIYFARTGLAVGAGRFEDWGGRFGFGETVPFMLPVAVSSLSRDGIRSEIQLADSSFGQGEVLITPLQAALLYCAFAAEGQIPLPRLQLSPAQEPAIWKTALEAKPAAVVHQALVNSIHGEGAPAARGAIEGFFVAGKTGTAQLNGTRGNICWYITYGPAENPQIVVAAMVEGGQWATEEAIPIGRAVMEAFLLAE